MEHIHRVIRGEATTPVQKNDRVIRTPTLRRIGAGLWRSAFVR